LQVEVSVQDCFYDSSQEEATNLELSDRYSDSAIAAETWEIWFHRWLEILHPNMPPALNYELTLRLTDDAEIQALNDQYRHQNKPTDVLAFAALEVDCPQPVEMQSLLPLYLGDIVISVDTAQRQAQQHGHTLQTELVWLAAHGLLHLLGWDHPDEDSLTRMLNQQALLLQTIGLAINTS
jgi:probable rRNA maturation factor